MDTLGERIRFLRTSEGLSMSKLAERLVLDKPVSSATISNAESNKHSPSIELVISISKYSMLS